MTDNTKEETKMTDNTKNKVVLKESNYKLSGVGKLFFAGVVAAIFKGVFLPLKLKGTPEQIKIIVDAIAASKAFQEEIHAKNASVESVISKLQLKNLTAQKFEQITHMQWPL